MSECQYRSKSRVGLYFLILWILFTAWSIDDRTKRIEHRLSTISSK